MAFGLLELASSLALQAVLLATLSGSLAGLAAAARGAWAIHHEISELARIEHLLDHALAHAGGGPTRPPAVASARADAVALHADLDGDGRIDARSAERTAFALDTGADGTRLIHRIGRQSMTVVAALPREARLEYRSLHDRPASAAAEVRLIRLPLAPHALVAAIPRER